MAIKEVSCDTEEFELVFGFIPRQPAGRGEVSKVEDRLHSLALKSRKARGKLMAGLNDHRSLRQISILCGEWETAFYRLARAYDLALAFGYVHEDQRDFYVASRAG